jgi:putative ABC transport system permease protein
MKESFQDLRYGWRMVQKTPGLSAVIVVMLALGIGANSAVFSIFSAILLRPLPYDHTDQLVQLNGLRNQGSFLEQPFSYPNFADVRDSNQVFSQMGAYSGTSASLSGKDGAEQVITPVASAGFFEALGVKPVLGRTFEIADDQGQAPPVVMLTYGGWQRRFGGSSDVIGKTLVLDGMLNTIVGVLPQDFQFGPSQSGDIWQSLRVKSWKLRRNLFWLNPVARLKPGMSAQQAQAGISALARQLEQKYPSDNAGVGVRLVPLEEQLVGPARPVLRLLMASVGFVLLITCANIAGLLVARSVQRQKEIAIRMAVGARRARIVRQLLTESILLALLGGSVGILTAIWSVPAIVGLIPKMALAAMPALQGLHVNTGVLAFSLALSVLTGIVFGMVPALQIAKPDLRQDLQEAGRGAVGGMHHRLRNILVVSEVALAVVLLVGAGLMLRSLQRVLNRDPGFDTGNLLTLGLALPQKGYGDNTQQLAFERRVLQEIHALPGVKDVAAVSIVPLSGSGNTSRFDVEGHPKASGGEEFEASSPTVSGNYFQVMGIPLRAGRFFGEQDTAKSTLVVIINQALADQVFHGQDPIGKRINFTYTDKPDLREIVGVVGDENVDRLDAKMQPVIYDSFEQDTSGYFSLVIRTGPPPETLADAVTKKLHEIDPEVPAAQVASMTQIIWSSPTMALRAYPAYLLTGFAGAALVLAVLGVYGLLTYSVVQRKRELGLRLALGAEPRDLRRLVVVNGIKLTLLGATVGVASAFAASRLMSSLLFEVKSTDTATFTGVCLLLVFATLPATYIPAWRATRVDPMETLRWE